MDPKYCDRVQQALASGYSHDHAHEHEHGQCGHGDPSSVPLLRRNNSDYNEEGCNNGGCNEEGHEHGHEHGHENVQPQVSSEEQVLMDFFNAIKYGLVNNNLFDDDLVNQIYIVN